MGEGGVRGRREDEEETREMMTHKHILPVYVKYLGWLPEGVGDKTAKDKKTLTVKKM